LIVNNTFAVLSRMLAWEDTKRLVEYIEGTLRFSVPHNVIAGHAKNWVETYEPREVLLRQGLSSVHAPRLGQISIYGPEAKYVLPLGFFEIGLPDDGNSYLEELRRQFPDFRINSEASYLPPGLAASERMFRVELPMLDRKMVPLHFSYDAEHNDVVVEVEGILGYRIKLKALGKDAILKINSPDLNSIYGEVDTKCKEFVKRLEEFHRKNILPTPE